MVVFAGGSRMVAVRTHQQTLDKGVELHASLSGCKDYHGLTRENGISLRKGRGPL